MRIVYIAKHDSGDNDDEGAITYALRQLGHRVMCVHERSVEDIGSASGDLILVHKLDCPVRLRRFSAPKVFWHFDLVESDDWELQSRSIERRAWMAEATDVCDLGFCTDGDWVAKDTTGKLHWLMQGADERYVGAGHTPEENTGGIDILFTGSQIHGGKRISFLNECRARYGDRFRMVGHRPRERVHGRRLADLIASAKIVVAPDGPCSDRYWSNRVYLTLGFGGFLIHPLCARLMDHYGPNDISYYMSREAFHVLVDSYLDRPDIRQDVAQHGYETTIAKHLYRHRCEELLRVVKLELGL